MDYVYRVTEAAQLPGLSLLIASLCAASNGPERRLIRPARQQSLADTRASGYKTRDRRGHWDRVCGAVPGRRGKRRRLRWTLQKWRSLRKLLIYKDRRSVKQDNAAWARKLPGYDRVRNDRVQGDEAGSSPEPAYGTLRPSRSVLTADRERAGGDHGADPQEHLAGRQGTPQAGVDRAAREPSRRAREAREAYRGRRRVGPPCERGAHRYGPPDRRERGSEGRQGGQEAAPVPDETRALEGAHGSFSQDHASTSAAPYEADRRALTKVPEKARARKRRSVVLENTFEHVLNGWSGPGRRRWSSTSGMKGRNRPASALHRYGLTHRGSLVHLALRSVSASTISGEFASAGPPQGRKTSRSSTTIRRQRQWHSRMACARYIRVKF